MKCIEMGENKFMQKKALLALLLVLTMILSGCSLIVKDEAVDAARVVIRVGDDTYTKAQVQAQIQNQVNYMTALYSRYGLSFDSTNADVMSSLTDNVLNSLVERSVLLAKAKELGLDQLTDEEKTKIKRIPPLSWILCARARRPSSPLTSKRSWTKSTPSWMKSATRRKLSARA